MHSLNALFCALVILAAAATPADADDSFSKEVAAGVKKLHDLAVVNKAGAVALRDAIKGKQLRLVAKIG